MKTIRLFLLAALSLTACSTLNQINIFSVEDDKELGKKMYAQIQQDTKEYPLLDPVKYATAYAHVNRIMKTILNTGVVDYATEFEWTVQIIDADVLNAFACPGGKMYVYKGLINYLDDEAQLAGVMAHEIAHIASRHSTRQLTKDQGVSYLTNLLLGDNPNSYLQLAAQMAGTLGGLSFSRTDEYEADNLAVAYLSYTSYNPLGVAGFFEKMIAEGQSSGASLTFLSTHPSSPDRIEKIKAAWVTYGSKAGDNFSARYKEVKNSLK